MKKKTVKIIIWTLGISIALLFVWRVYKLVLPKNGNGNFRNGKARAVAVEAEKIKIGSIQEQKEFTGTILPLYEYYLAPKISGQIEKISKNIGDFVNKNEILVKIDDTEYQQALLEAQAELKIAEANFEKANSDYEIAQKDFYRITSLKENNYVSSSELENANAKYISAQSSRKLAQAQIEQKKAALKLSEIKLSYTILRANKSGYIAEKLYDEGNLLSANSSLLKIVGIDTLIIRANITERIYGKIKSGQKAIIEADAFPNDIFEGKVSRVSPILDESSRMSEMEIEVSNKNNMLHPGMFCNVKITLAEKENTQIVPNKALVAENGSIAVFKVNEKESIAEYIPVKLGIISENESEIISPKLDGLIVTIGQYQLKDGSKIILPGQKSSQKPKNVKE